MFGLTKSFNSKQSLNLIANKYFNNIYDTIKNEH